MSAQDPGSITHWFDDLKAGRPEAAEALWHRYFERLVGVARRRLVDAPHQAVEDAEDAALSALHGLYSGAAQGRFENLADRADLWRLLVAITVKKALEQRRRHGRKKRGGDLRLINTTDLTSIKKKYNVPHALEGCHTAVIGPYVFEGLVPAEDIKRVLDEDRPIKGLSVLGMQMGAPGMPGTKSGPINVYYLSDTSPPKIFTTF